MLESAWVLAMLRWNGRLDDDFDTSKIFVVAIAPYVIWVRFYLDRVAARAMDAFRPALAVSDEEFSRLRYELTTLPAPLTRIATIAAIVGYVLNALLLPDQIIAQFGSSRGVAAVLLAPVATFTLAVVAISTTQAVRQLWMVDLIYGLAQHVNLFRVKPFYAFSGLTSRTGMSFLVLAYFIAAVRPDIVRETPALQLMIVAMLPTAVACFVLPLYGITSGSSPKRTDCSRRRMAGSRRCSRVCTPESMERSSATRTRSPNSSRRSRWNARRSRGSRPGRGKSRR